MTHSTNLGLTFNKNKNDINITHGTIKVNIILKINKILLLNKLYNTYTTFIKLSTNGRNKNKRTPIFVITIPFLISKLFSTRYIPVKYNENSNTTKTIMTVDLSTWSNNCAPSHEVEPSFKVVEGHEHKIHSLAENNEK
jgi:hypothetical protein